MSGKRVVVGMSGGVDSSVAAALLKEQGYDVVGVTLSLSPALDVEAAAERTDACCTLGAVEDARRVADRLGIAHYTLNFRDVFADMVIANFVDEYRRGRTPNPCIRCNDYVKFEAVLRRSTTLGADLVATGHYASVDRDLVSGRYLLRRGVDRRKDQSYVLYVLTQNELARTLLPLGRLTKDQVRDLARRLGLRVADKPESQDICFVVDGDYRAFVEKVAPDAVRPGPIVDLAGNTVGEHRGIAFHTIGQRRGLGVATGRPLYVVDIDATGNTLVVGPESALYRDEVVAEDANLVSIAGLDRPMRVQAKVRYRMTDAPGWLSQPGPGRLALRFDGPQRAVTPGQALVCYTGDTVVGGGTIARAVRSVGLTDSAREVRLADPW